jgi:hypothetical protein
LPAGRNETLIVRRPQCIVNTGKQMGGATVNLPDKKDKQIVSAALAQIIWW